MIPPLIVRRAVELGLEMIAVTDHNSTRNAGAVIEAAAGTGLTVLAGMEASSQEEVHLICLFDSLEQADAWGETVSEALPDLENDEAHFGAQYVVDVEGKHVDTEMRLLAAPTTLSVEQIVAGVRALDGIVIPAHVDRPASSLISNLGFVPEGIEIPGLELSRHADVDAVARRLPQIDGYGLLVCGDAHRLAEMTARTMMNVQAPTVREIALALTGQDGRWSEALPAQDRSPATRKVAATDD
jgi:PHP family Zn ribbon phosphoesterase